MTQTELNAKLKSLLTELKSLENSVDEVLQDSDGGELNEVSNHIGESVFQIKSALKSMKIVGRQYDENLQPLEDDEELDLED